MDSHSLYVPFWFSRVCGRTQPTRACLGRPNTGLVIGHGVVDVEGKSIFQRWQTFHCLLCWMLSNSIVVTHVTCPPPNPTPTFLIEVFQSLIILTCADIIFFKKTLLLKPLYWLLLLWTRWLFGCQCYRGFADGFWWWWYVMWSLAFDRLL